MANDNERWIIDAGDTVVQRRIAHGMARLKPLDRLIYCLWIADYGMRNAGDLAAACDLYASFQDEASQLSKELVLTVTQSAFALPRAKLRTSCITRGRGGWLDLPRGGLAPPILCQLSWRTLEWVKGCLCGYVSITTGVVPPIAADWPHCQSRQSRAISGRLRAPSEARSTMTRYPLLGLRNDQHTRCQAVGLR